MSQVDIVIPTKTPQLIESCLSSIDKNAAASRKLIRSIVIGITGRNEECHRAIEKFKDLPITAVDVEGQFNYSKCNNMLVERTLAEYALFMNDDVELTCDCITPCVDVLDHDQRVGTVGINLLYPDGSSQHCGIFIIEHDNGIGVGHIGLKQRKPFPDMWTAGNTGAFLMVRKIDFYSIIEGFDEEYETSFQDVQLNLDILATHKKGCVTLNSVSAIHKEKQTRDGKDTVADICKLARWFKNTRGWIHASLAALPPLYSEYTLPSK